MVNKTIDWGLNVSALLLFALFMYVLGSMVSPRLGEVEGYFFPVSKVTDFNVVGEIDGDAIVSGLYDRYRSGKECHFRRSQWYKKPGAEIKIERLDEVQIHDIGTDIPWGRLRLNVSPETAENEIYVHAYHQCHLLGIPLPWLTRTETWRSP